MTAQQRPTDSDAETSEDSTHDGVQPSRSDRLITPRRLPEPPEDWDMDRLVTRRAIQPHVYSAARSPSTVLPLWVEWAIAVATVLLGVAAIAIAVGTFRLTARAEAAAAQSKSIAEWQRYDQELANFRQMLEHRIGYAHDLLNPDELDLLVLQFPRSPGEPPEQRAERLREQGSTIDANTHQEYESLIFIQQPDSCWKLEMQWSTDPSVEAAFEHTARQFLVPVVPLPPVPGATALSATGPKFLLVTRRAGAGVPA